MSKNIFNCYGLKTPYHIVISSPTVGKIAITKEIIDKINQSLPFPIIIKPINSGSSLGVSVVTKSADLEEALKKSFAHSPFLMVKNT
jgi:D-alanine-D-alanine ligase-like ATP-grasp enzyme